MTTNDRPNLRKPVQSLAETIQMKLAGAVLTEEEAEYLQFLIGLRIAKNIISGVAHGKEQE